MPVRALDWGWIERREAMGRRPLACLPAPTGNTLAIDCPQESPISRWLPPHCNWRSITTDKTTAIPIRFRRTHGAQGQYLSVDRDCGARIPFMAVAGLSIFVHPGPIERRRLRLQQTHHFIDGRRSILGGTMKIRSFILGIAVSLCVGQGSAAMAE